MLVSLLHFLSFAVYAQGNIKALAQTELEFAKEMQTSGIKKGWLKYLDSNAIRFTKANQPENAFKYWQNNERPGTFDWAPELTEVSSSGNFGYTTGLIAYYKSMDISKPAEYYGGYISVWKRNADGEWKVIFDIGTGYPVQTSIVTQVKELVTINSKTKKKGDVNSLLFNDSVFNISGNKSNRSYKKHLGKPFMLFAEGGTKVTAVDSLFLHVSKIDKETFVKIYGCQISDSGDLGYVYGAYEYDKKTRMYLRIWRREKSKWKLALEYVR